MARPPSDPDILAGSGGVRLGEARTNHQGRRALLLVRGEEDTSEMKALAATMGIDIVETVAQKGRADPRTYFGAGRVDDVAQWVISTPDHPWYGVDLVLLHTNATPRQLVGINAALGIEAWDRVRLLLALFTAHASSVEARTQVRIAQLQSDRTMLREAVQQQTTGERAGYGGGGVTALQNVIANLNRELTNLRRRQRKHANAQREHRRQRTRSGARTVGFVGYTNAGKSSLFQRLSGKTVLVEDRLFSTLETTVGRMEKSPRILLVDTIGFIDNIPNATLAAFKATIAEAINADLTVILLDASDPYHEAVRKLETTQLEVLERQDEPVTPLASQRPPQVLLTKIDQAHPEAIAALAKTVTDMGFPEPLAVSSLTGEGVDAFQHGLLCSLFGSPVNLRVSPPAHVGDEATERWVSMIYEAGMVEDDQRFEDGSAELLAWLSSSSVAQLMAQANGRIEVK